jgi:hypothetical protein
MASMLLARGGSVCSRYGQALRCAGFVEFARELTRELA